MIRESYSYAYSYSTIGSHDWVPVRQRGLGIGIGFGAPCYEYEYEYEYVGGGGGDRRDEIEWSSKPQRRGAWSVADPGIVRVLVLALDEWVPQLGSRHGIGDWVSALDSGRRFSSASTSTSTWAGAGVIGGGEYGFPIPPRGNSM